MLIDSHAHLDFDELSENLPNIVKNANYNKISSILSINTKLNEFNKLFNLIKKYKSIWCSVGEHPCNININNIPNKNDIISLINNKVIAIGETGLDLYYSSKNFEYQLESLKNHIDASIETNLPLIIHQRNSENELMNFLIKENINNNLKVIMHCFTGSSEMLTKCLDNDFFISISGIITFKNSYDLKNIICNIPINKLLIETDSPFLSPVPNRGKTNEPSNVYYTAKFLSNLFKIQFDNFCEQTTNNFYKLFTKAIKYESIIYES